MNVPKLRFKEFDDEYKLYKFNEVAKLYRGSSPRPIINFITRSEDGVNWIKIGDVSPNETYINSTSEKITQEGSKKSRKVYKGDIILSNSMSFGRPYILNLDGCIHDGWFVVRDYENLLCKDYLYHFMSSPLIQKQYKTLSAGGVVSNISSDLVYSVKFNIPSKNEQLKVANLLSLLDKKIELQSKKIEDLKLFKKGLVNKISENISETKSINEICEYKNGNSYEEYVCDDGKFNLISLNSVDINGNLKNNMKKINFNNPETLIKDDIVMVLSDVAHGDFLGISTLIDENDKYVLNQRMGLLRIKDDSIPQFIVEMINNEQKKFKILGQGSSQLNLSKDDILNQKIKYPCIYDQNKFAIIFNNLNIELKLNENKLIKLQELKKGLMQSMFV